MKYEKYTEIAMDGSMIMSKPSDLKTGFGRNIQIKNLIIEKVIYSNMC